MFNRITFVPGVMGGRACIRGMRITVSLVVNLVANGMSSEEIILEYPDLEPEYSPGTVLRRRTCQRRIASICESGCLRFLADMGISMTTVKALRAIGGDAVHLREQGLHRMPDSQILDKAIHEQRVILTCDLDFTHLLAAGGGATPSVVLFRTRNQTPAFITPRLFEVLVRRMWGCA